MDKERHHTYFLIYLHVRHHVRCTTWRRQSALSRATSSLAFVMQSRCRISRRVAPPESQRSRCSSISTQLDLSLSLFLSLTLSLSLSLTLSLSFSPLSLSLPSFLIICRPHEMGQSSEAHPAARVRNAICPLPLVNFPRSQTTAFWSLA